MLGRKQHFVPKKSHFGQSGLRNSPPSGQTATYRKTEGTQSYLRIWGTYDPIESGPSEPKKWGFHRYSIMKCRSLGKKWAFRFSGRWPFGRSASRFMALIAHSGSFGVQKSSFLARNHFFCGHPCKGVNRKMLSFWCPVMVVTNKVGQFPKKMGSWPKNCIFYPKFCVFLRYTYETPISLARTVPTQWDDNSSISWGNSGYLWFSGRWPFGHSAGRFVAPIAQSGPFGVQKCCFLARNHFFCGQPQNKLLQSWRDT